MIIREKNPHGGQIYDKNILLDFSVNVNPNGTPDSVIEAAISGVMQSSSYPDAFCTELRKAIALHYGTDENFVICSNGGAELIFQTVAALKPKRGLIVEPTFCEYRQSLEATGCIAETYQLKAENGFNLEASEKNILDKIKQDTDVVFICNPNNPTGMVTPKTTLNKILAKCNQVGAALFIDESFGELSEGYDEFSMISEVESSPNLFILKSMTKTYAIAGLRLGFGLCADEKLIERICKHSQCWNVSLPAQMAGIQSLKCTDYVKNTLKILVTEKEFLTKRLTNLGIKVFEGRANYLMIQADRRLYSLLLAKGIMIRQCSNFCGLDDSYFRIAVRDHDENLVLIQTLEEIGKEVDLCIGQV
ncbi:MAG: aminotransferase class I/II-fold pyridoxal phosphate-dependent enzyme [Firmicutes bacterium]|jgi:threonine-phosphate decarboxylase|nr:aminotransferase class I/II-fold pyridoxal phosphate-dependent enzyme [Bacillota bacterium]